MSCKDCNYNRIIRTVIQIQLNVYVQFQIAARKEKELHNVNANIKRKITSVVADKYGGEPVMDD